MKRNLNENAHLDEGVKICVSEIRNDDQSMDCNELRDIFVEEGAEVEGSHGFYDGAPATFMTVYNLNKDRVVEILQDFLNASENVAPAEDYIQEDEELENDFPAYEDVEVENDLDPEEDALNDEALLEGDNILDDAKEELRDVLSRIDDEIYLSDDGIVLDTVLSDDNLTVYSINSDGDMETNEEDIINAFDLTDADDIFTLCDVIKDALEFDAQYPAYDDVDIDDDEQPRFEKMKRHGRLDAKKKNDCCPGTGKVNEAEAIDAVLADIDAQVLNEAKEAEAKKQNALEVKTLKALSENQHSLHSNISYNGKTFDKMTLKELKNLYETVNASVEELTNKTLNESAIDEKLLNTINNKKQLLNYRDEEITYRTTRMECLKKLNEDSAEISDEELKNLFGPAQGEEETPAENKEESSEENKDENSEENKEESSEENKDEDGEVVELSRIVITLKDSEAANDLKQACIEAEIPEDAFELENVEEESATEDEENSEENKESDENSEENAEEENSEENAEESANESYEYAKYVKYLMEGEIPAEEQSAEEVPAEDQQPEENTEENSEENNEENSEEEEEDKQPKFILTNTDYASKLAKVLEDVYGISKEEFEEMVGGKIVEEDSEEENKDENSEENKEESSEENKEESSEENKNDEEEIDPSDLFKNL